MRVKLNEEGTSALVGFGRCGKEGIVMKCVTRKTGLADDLACLCATRCPDQAAGHEAATLRRSGFVLLSTLINIESPLVSGTTFTSIYTRQAIRGSDLLISPSRRLGSES